MYSNNRGMRERERCCGQDDRALPQVRRKSRTPSFSSSLLDSICRSIDLQQEESEPPHLGFYRETEPTLKKQSNGDRSRRQRDNSLKRALIAEAWIEKHTSSSSSDSSSGGGTLFSSSETESTYRDKLASSGLVSRPKIEKPKQDRDGFAKTKLRALKIYGELKKVKQPISPGGRISSFLNSIFSPKAKMCSAGAAAADVNFECKSKSACSSAASFSRSCMNKTGRNLTGDKRSVRFYPVSVIVGEDSRPCGHKCIHEEDPSLMPTPSMARKVEAEAVMNKQSVNCSVEAAAREILMRSYQKSKCMIEFDDDDEDEDDAKSCASSDLFELDHLIGKAGRYREELPVYETTSLRTNKAIAGGFIF